MNRMKLIICPVLFCILFLSCAADKQNAVQAAAGSQQRAAQDQSRRYSGQNDPDRNQKSLIMVKGNRDTICLAGCVGIFTGQHSSKLTYATVADRIDKGLGINIKTMSFDEISESSRNKLLSNGVQSISVVKKGLTLKAIGFYKTVGSDWIFLVKSSKIHKTDWAGRAQLYAEKLDIEFLHDGKICNAVFEVTYAGQKTPTTRWGILDENRQEMDKNRNDRLNRGVNSLIAYLCGQQGLNYILPSSYCKK